MENKTLILNKAVSLFSVKGFDGVGVQEICTESNITKPTLYYYFSSKAGLLSAIIETYGNEYLERIGKAAQYRRDFIGSLTDLLLCVAEFALKGAEYTEFFRLHCALSTASELSEGGKIYRPFAERVEKVFAAFFKESANEIGNMRGKEELFARIFQGTCRSVALEVCQHVGEGQSELIHSVVHAFAYGVVNG